MLGWEFPPMVSGGLGVACYGLVKALNGMGVDVLFVLPKPLAGTRAEEVAARRAPVKGQEAQQALGEETGNGKLGRVLARVREVKSATAQEVLQAVEKSAAKLQAASIFNRPDPAAGAQQFMARPGPQPAGRAETQWQTHAAAGRGTDLPFEEPAREMAASGSPEEGQTLQRVVFVPLDVWLEPYMTPGQYQKMVVEELATNRPVTSWEKEFQNIGGRWVERAVSAGATAPVQQPPPWPGPPAPTEEQKSAALHALPAPPPMAPAFAGDAQERSYIEEPARSASVQGPEHTQYAGDLFAETERYARLAMTVARGEKFSLVHAHDWMTFEAAMAVAAASGKPLVLQIHSTELDRAGANANRRIMEIERNAMAVADRVIAVSYRTKTQLIEKYGVDPQKIEVVYNASEPPPSASDEHAAGPLRKRQKNVLFLGRLTQQKGPDYFLRAAKKVLSVEPDVKFVIAGKGDLLDDLKELSVELGIRKKVLFTGFLKREPLEKALRAADVYVMPSLSEPFGIAPLEALSRHVPVIISKQTGVAEVLHHVLKVDFWDTDDLANKILALLHHAPLAQTLRDRGRQEARNLSWDDSARRIAELYETVSHPKTAPLP